MKYRMLGATGLMVSEIGFGAWGIGGLTAGATSYGPTDDTESKCALRTAFERGITLFDTSNIYGNGHSETLIGETFRGMRDKVVIASKVGFMKHGGPHDVSRDYMRWCLEKSLRRLETDYIDLYQLHSPPLRMVTAQVVETLDTFKHEGKIRAYGFSVQDPDDGITAIAELGFKALQVNFSMLDLRAEKNGLLTLAKERNVGIIARTPFNFGFLTGTVKTTSFDSRDHRSNWSSEQLDRWAKAPDLFSALNEGKGRTLAQLALQFCLSSDAVASVIPGILHPNEAEEDANASDLDPLTEDELAKIGQIHKSHVFWESKP